MYLVFCKILFWGLFCICVNDIFKVSNLLKAVLYADDTTVSCKGIDELIELALAQFKLYPIWFSDYLLALNSTKTNCVLLYVSKSVATNFPDVLHLDAHHAVEVNFASY